MQRKAGIALLLGALVSIFRVLPIVLSDGVTGENFPPESLDDVIFFSQLGGWHVSHVLFLVLLPLLAFGVLELSRTTARNGPGSAALMASVVFSLSLVLYAVAIVFDGFVLPHVADHPDASVAASPQAALVLFTHEAASIVGGTASALLLVAMLFIGIGLLRGSEQRTLGMIGLAIGGLSTAGYLIGWLDLNISDGFGRVGPLLMAAFVHLAVTGVTMIRGASGQPTGG